MNDSASASNDIGVPNSMTSPEEPVQSTLSFLAQRGWRGDDDFFAALAAHLARVLAVDYAFVDRIVPDAPERVATIALWAKGGIEKNFDYDLVGTPCENVLGQDICFYRDNIQGLFPNDALLVDMNAESYAGIPLWASDGTALGLIAVMHTNPISNRDTVETVLRMVELRASAELERRLLTDELAESHHRVQDFADVSSDWFWETDANHRYVWFSPNVEEVAGVPPEWHYGKTRQEIGSPDIPKKDWDAHLEMLSKHLPYKNFEFKRRGPDGDKWLRSSGKPIFDADGVFKGYRGTGSDITPEITRRLALEQELRTAKENAESSNRAKSTFLAKMSHDLRTPLNAVVGLGQMMEQQVYGELGHPKYQEYSRDIVSSGNYLLELVCDILDMSRIETGHIKIDLQDLKLKSVIDEVISIVMPAPSDNHPRIDNLVTDSAISVRTDLKALHQILVNLLSNAAKFTPAGGRITVSAAPTDDGVRIVVQDNGIGMSPEAVVRVGEPFTGAQDAYKAATTEGTGLGLSIVTGLLEHLGSNLEISSDLGHGTTASFTLPLAR